MRSIATTVFCAALALLAAPVVNGHICIIEPHQRGALDVSNPGDDTCFRRNGNCGGIPAGPPTQTYTAGVEVEVHIQQNLNHWWQEDPGFIDLAVSYTGGTDGPFTTLARIGDYPANEMVTQTNFTLRATFTQSSDAAVLRARYVSRNHYEVDPANNTQAIFYNCADIIIVDDNENKKAIKTADEAPKKKEKSSKRQFAGQSIAARLGGKVPKGTDGGFSCKTPARWSAVGESILEGGAVSMRHHIRYDTVSKWVRWDRTNPVTNVTLSTLANYTLNSWGSAEYVWTEGTEDCALFGADRFYPWQYGNHSNMNCMRSENSAVCWPTTDNGLMWRPRVIESTSGETLCLPEMHTNENQYWETTYYTAKEETSFPPGTFDVPSFCKKPGMVMKACH